jgi:phosphopantothenoylcysteine decarboxylase / phosphopantothenate---cysteine ligase
MASITIRNLDEATKQTLRERAAGNGRSMEEEARLLLGAGVRDTVSQDFPAPDDDASLEDYPAAGGSVLLIVTGGIAAYKALDLIRRLRERGVKVRCVMTAAARQFVSELAVGAISGARVFGELWDRDAEHDIGHIRLAREADLVVVAPATADLMAKMANGTADDLASAVLLARSSPVLLAPAMNPAMWNNAATKRNVATLRGDGVQFIGPETGEMAESGEAGTGRMAEPMAIVARIGALIDRRPKPLAGLSAIVTSGPTHEPIDPVRYIANRSSGKQGHAIAAALAAAGARVTLVSGPVNLADPPGVATVRVKTARQMAAAVMAALPADLAVMVAAVADWRSVNTSDEKMKKKHGMGPPSLELTENPDILKTVGNHRQRPRLVIGFAAETQDLEKNAQAKLEAKGADWIVANDVSDETGIMGGDRNTIHLISRSGSQSWPDLSKSEVARRLVAQIAQWFKANTAQA